MIHWTIPFGFAGAESGLNLFRHLTAALADLGHDGRKLNWPQMNADKRR
jgi:hypothetical protein